MHFVNELQTYIPSAMFCRTPYLHALIRTSHMAHGKNIITHVVPSSGNIVVQSRFGPFLDSWNSMVADHSWLTLLFYTVALPRHSDTYNTKQGACTKNGWVIHLDRSFVWCYDCPIYFHPFVTIKKLCGYSCYTFFSDFVPWLQVSHEICLNFINFYNSNVTLILRNFARGKTSAWHRIHPK